MILFLVAGIFGGLHLAATLGEQPYPQPIRELCLHHPGEVDGDFTGGRSHEFSVFLSVTNIARCSGQLQRPHGRAVKSPAPERPMPRWGATASEAIP